ncbi:universal stress protein [Aminicella lysinilytica]|uniref:universal stress protein n=1 Tax=Aminicella lysinilytica TaxID=433323 RepID=UPI0026EE8400|nr:universal stress protein [Aminicella lysinilytica]
MKKLLIPIDGSDRSIEAVDAIKTIYRPDRVEITLLTVREDVDTTSQVFFDRMEKESMAVLDQVAEKLSDYQVTKAVKFGVAGNTILKYAKQNDIDVIVIVKRTHKGISMFLGSVSVHLIKYAHIPVVVLPEEKAEL